MKLAIAFDAERGSRAVGVDPAAEDFDDGFGLVHHDALVIITGFAVPGRTRICGRSQLLPAVQAG